MKHEGKAQWYPKEAKEKEAVKQNIQLHILDRAFSRDLREEKEVQATRKYALDASYGQSRQYIRCAAEMPNMVQVASTNKDRSLVVHQAEGG